MTNSLDLVNQLQEILDTKDPARREYLFYGLIELCPGVIRPTELPQLFDSDEGFDPGERYWETNSLATRPTIQ